MHLRPRVQASEDGRRWTVLFIGDHGKVIAFKRVRILLALAGAAFLLSLAAVCVLVVVNHTLHRRNTELQQGLEASGAGDPGSSPRP